MALSECEVAIVGAGPYGLAAAAHLGPGRTGDVRVFGDPMSFWRDRMPVGMLLRSPYVASHIADPDRALTLDDYQAAEGLGLSPPVPLEHFVDYGRWFQRRVVPDIDRRWITSVERDNGGFRLTPADGEQVTARRVVVAAGIASFPRIPAMFGGFDSQRVFHASERRDMGPFAGKRVAVVGGGQSALEAGALLSEAGAQAEVLVRSPRIFFLGRRPWMHKPPLGPLLYAPPDVGPAGVSRLVAAPAAFRRLPRRWQDRLGPRSIRPAGAGWLQPRLEPVTVTLGRAVTAAALAGDGVRLELADGSARTVDHVLLATGYEVDLARYDFLAPRLLGAIARVGGYPRLSAAFETSVAGLHVIGAPAAWSFGPLMRFVAGTEFTAPALAAGIAGRRRRRRASGNGGSRR